MSSELLSLDTGIVEHDIVDKRMTTDHTQVITTDNTTQCSASGQRRKQLSMTLQISVRHNVYTITIKILTQILISPQLFLSLSQLTILIKDH